VLIYALFIFLDFVVPEVVMGGQGGFTPTYQSFIINWTRFFWVVDLGFLTLFIIEISVRTYAWGIRGYLWDKINLIDAIIVWASFAMLFATFNLTMGDGGAASQAGSSESALDSSRSLLRVFRLMRVFRIVIILNKIKRSRENAQILRKKAKYKRQGSPVERVIDILQRFRRKAENNADRENLSFIMDAIISDQLYTVSVSQDSSTMSTEMSAFLLEGGANTGVKPEKRQGAGADAASKGGGKGGGSPQKGKRGGKGGDDGAPAEAAAQATDAAPTVGDGGGPRGGGDRRTSIALRTGELAWVESLHSTNEVKAALSEAGSWDFSIFELDKVSNRHPVLIIALEMVQRFDLEATLPVPVNNLVKLLLRVEAGYNNVPFHNYLHAADVTHGTAYFLSQENVARHISPLDIYCMILGAAMHDFNHPGFNNAFLVASRNSTAVLYNDLSVLENFHIASAWKLMLEDDMNPFQGFTDEQYQEARQTLVYAILGTDMKFHFDHLTKFKTRLNAGAFEDPDRKDIRLLLAMCLHSADVSNPAKKWDYTVEWAARVMEEFFQQGEKEASLGLPVSPFMDRKKTDIGQCQAGFISILIKPFFDEWTQFLGDANRHIFTNVEENIKIWQEQGESALSGAAKELHEGRRPKGSGQAGPLPS
jgi:hypothetical protein